MAYATISHVTARNPERTYGVNSKPTTTQVAEFLDETAGIIDSILLEVGYALPVLPPASGGASSAWLVLQDANAVGGWYKAEWAAQASDKRSEAEDMWQTAQKMLRTVQLALGKDAAESLPRGGSTECATPFFTRCMIL